MDAIDAKLLQILASHGRATHAQLAEQVGLSLSACQRRVKSLETRGAIQGYRAVVDPALLEEGRVVFVGVNLERHARADIQAFQRSVALIPAVKEVHHIAGEYDYLLKVAVRDLDAYEVFHADHLAALNGVARITSFIAISTFKG